MTTPPRLAAALEGRYSIERELGQGGMATVYLAADLKHDRKVALKVLKPELAAVLGADRFVVEIKTTASLQHPHILPLFDSGTADGFLYYVMPFIEGETLRDKLTRETQLGVDDAVRIARDVGDALQYAHSRGVIHRDIKPENILLHDGRPMIVDFGIALAVSAAAGGRMTETGLSLGTPHYMSPEQATADKDITARSDIYSLATVLYEMLAGQPPHVGGAAQQVIMKIITDTARPVGELRRNVPPNVEAALAKALEKLPADRFESARSFGDALSNPAFSVRSRTKTSGIPSRRWRDQIAMPALLCAVLFAGFAVWSFLKPATISGGISAAVRVVATLPPTAPRTGRVAALPGGTGIIYVGGVAGSTRLYVRGLDRDSVMAIAGTEGASLFSVSPSGAQIAFRANGSLWVLPIAGGTPRQLPVNTAHSFDWIDEQRLVVAVATAGRGLSIVRVRDGASTVLTTTDSTRVDRMHLSPVVVDGGKYVLFVVRPSVANPIVRVGIVPTRGGEPRFLDLEGATPLGFVAGRLVYLDANDRIMAVLLDIRTGVMGEPAVVLPYGNGAALSTDGTLVHVAGVAQALAIHIDENGHELSVDTIPLLGVLDPDLSPGGDRFLMQARRGTSYGVYMYDRARRTISGASTTGVSTIQGRWHPDGNRLIALRQIPPRGAGLGEALRGSREIWLEFADRSDSARRIGTLPQQGNIAEFTPDGRALLVVATGAIKLMSLQNGSMSDLPSGPLTGGAPALSPDGKLLAFVMDDAGTNEVFVTSAIQRGSRVKVSSGGGTAPQWTRTGRLVFQSGNRIMSTSVRQAPSLVAEPATLFAGPIGEQAAWPGYVNYALSPDGRGFYVFRNTSDRAGVVVTLNWSRHAFSGAER